jgi:hypothetical protein
MRSNIGDQPDPILEHVHIAIIYLLFLVPISNYAARYLNSTSQGFKNTADAFPNTGEAFENSTVIVKALTRLGHSAYGTPLKSPPDWYGCIDSNSAAPWIGASQILPFPVCEQGLIGNSLWAGPSSLG